MAGIAAAGNWIVDQIKFIDAWPNIGELANILGQDMGGGGLALNCLTDIAKAEVGIPLYGLGCIGNDEGGEFVRNRCANHGINLDFIVTLDDGTPTSYTDVMTIKATGERTFFHSRGANAQFAPEHVPIQRLAELGVKLFHFGYLLLLDAMDREDEEYGIVAARLLAEVKNTGIETSVDVVSESSDRFRKVVLPVLPYVDHVIINEVEAEKITGFEIRTNNTIDKDILIRAATSIFEHGVHKTVVIHFPEGAIWMDKDGSIITKPSYKIDPASIVSTVGAGDAFCSGILIGLHKDWTPEECLAAGTDMACACLFGCDGSCGIENLSTLQIRHSNKYSLREDF